MTLTKTHFLFFQRLLGIYLGCIFYSYFEAADQMIPRAVFDLGVLKSQVLLNLFSDPTLTRVFCVIMMLASTCLILNAGSVMAALVLYYGWLCQINSFSYLTPHDPYIGWLILAVAVFPRSDAGQASDEFPRRLLYVGAVVVLGVSYMLSGIDKLQSPAWAGGLTLEYVLTSPIARWDIASSFFEWAGGVPRLLLRGLSYLSLALEILFLPLFLIPLTRKWVWVLTTSLHLINFLVLQIPAVSAGMLLFHFFILDREWFRDASKQDA